MRYLGPRTAAYYERMHKTLFSTTVEDYRPVIKKGNGVWVEDIDGNQFLDFTSQVGIIGSGQCPEEVVSAIGEQARFATGIISNDFQFSAVHGRGALLGEEVSPVALAEKLIELAPVPYPKKVIFEVSGATAVSAAAKLCVLARPNAPFFAAFDKAFHGRHGYSLDLSSSKQVHKLLHQEGLRVVRLPFPKRGAAFRDFLKLLPQDYPLSVLFVEIVQGEGGINIPDLKLLNAIRRYAAEVGALFVVDEVQTGLGRTGKLFASEYLNLPPDMIILSKALGGGLPLGAVIARTDILPAGDLPKGAHSGTMPASPLAVAAALANLKILSDPVLLKEVKKLGKYLVEGLWKIAHSNRNILDVDSLGGLMIGVELVSKKICEEVICACLSEEPGLLLIGAGQKTIRFMPPLIVTKEEIDLALSIFKKALNTLV
ncbi:hypothetical protein A2926_00405 [Candidatus Giovannonibacteria bacterium RIFCSPLOWO2_01_FULL_44_40]|uniref:Acetylornithine aminotransferase n=1 Tax=Candidatus Giovannonibacteria bacterium RIFCSPHIGHO2_01_FULL_45_23 TaxID=1798325 RepID=A0A1F5VER4_9BACT|nr:MAG: hypothetical protein A2834_00420 [Candidatus Giovannonibacteria bacterium RIFCSPHIGHO2_01_FULL_45_23]OGF76511.1 MAG: hypothetical protein A3C77_03125 [Candidatus Giovannonibacteria bacterium RIFCSPHIGHO2_02_FULL_45_13]OGF79777.1 MAG: hypothetical protein A2926_00405 [Candidatus Giovannonibacteria bacterium RIFCSPLOWO2_01_FULL_44_40]